MALCLSQEIVTLLYRCGDELTGNVIGLRLGVESRVIHRRLPTLVKKGWMTRSKPLGATCSKYSVSSEQFERYVARANAPMARVALHQQDEAQLARKLKFLGMIGRGVCADNPVLAEIIADYTALRRRQSSLENPK